MSLQIISVKITVDSGYGVLFAVNDREIIKSGHAMLVKEFTQRLVF